MVRGLLGRFIRTMLFEGKVDDVKLKFPNVPGTTVDELAEADPTGTQKYLLWMVKQIDMEPGLPIEEILDAIMQFHARSSALAIKDIQRYKRLADLRDALGSLGSSRASDESAARAAAKKIFEDDGLVVVHPTNREASCVYGKGTKWCISATRTQNYFDSYAQRGIKFYFILNKKRKDNYSNMAIVVPDPDNVIADGHNMLHGFDASDKMMTLDELSRVLGTSTFEKVMNSVMKDAYSGEVPLPFLLQYTSDKDLLMRLAKGGQYIGAVVENPHATPEIIDVILDSAKDDTQAVSLAKRIVHPTVEQVRSLAARGFFGAVAGLITAGQSSHGGGSAYRRATERVSDGVIDAAFDVMSDAWGTGVGEAYLAAELALVARASDHIIQLLDLAFQKSEDDYHTNEIRTALIGNPNVDLSTKVQLLEKTLSAGIELYADGWISDIVANDPDAAVHLALVFARHDERQTDPQREGSLEYYLEELPRDLVDRARALLAKKAEGMSLRDIII